ncbi:MAG: helix-turn-helix domain-containing protein [Lentisphaeria bacterium]|nr:helix-turn-helix domain-containing protein [Lentisphaeria bacterium]
MSRIGHPKKKTSDVCELSSGNFFEQPDLPVRVQLCRNRRVVWHRHKDFYELVIICNGSARNLNQAGAETVHAGNVFLMPDQTTHRYSDLKDFRYYDIIFDPSLLKDPIPAVHLESLAGYPTLFDFQFTGENRHSRLLTVNRGVLAKLVMMATELHAELTRRQNGWREVAYFLFMQILVTLLRDGFSEEFPAGQNVFPIGRAIRLMEQDCTRNYTIRSLAEEVDMSPSCFRHNFTRIMGMPPREYLLSLRIRKAVMLLGGPASISQVAVLSGFPDSNYFSRIIRSRFGCSPSEIRRRCNSGDFSPESLIEKITLPKMD